MGCPFFWTISPPPPYILYQETFSGGGGMVLEWLRTADDMLWGPGTLALLAGTGAF